MLDFCSALYLGLRHESDALRPWSEMTRGVPAALAEPPGAAGVARELAAIQGCERAVLATSTLHLFWDLFGQFDPHDVSVHLDDATYSVGRWGAERAAARGVEVSRFRHRDADALRRQLAPVRAARRRRPVVVADGFCPACGRVAPVADYLRVIRPLGGTLVLDDTQALGVLGRRRPGGTNPYGAGGGGSLRWTETGGPDVLLIASLAKAFGAPIAALSGGGPAVAAFAERSEVREHCSPPSVAAVRAAENALAVNRREGDALRARLARLVTRFRLGLDDGGLSAAGGLFPVQAVRLPRHRGPDEARKVHGRLLRAGVRTVLHKSNPGSGGLISFIITARHAEADVDQAAAALAAAAWQTRGRPRSFIH